MKTETPDVFVIGTVPTPYRYFASLTFRSERVANSERLRWSLLLAWLRDVAGQHGVRYRRLLWVAREELGERTSRRHFHALLGAEEIQPSRGHCFRAMHSWELLAGFARVRVYDPSRSATDYLLKGLDGKDAYESSKFGVADKVEVSESLASFIRKRRMSSLVVGQPGETKPGGPAEPADPLRG